MLHPDLSIRVEERQNTQKKAHDNKQKQRLFDVNDPVYVKNFHAGDKWLPGEVLKVLGTRSYLVKLSLGKTVRRHLDHVKFRKVDVSESHSDDWVISTPTPIVVDTEQRPEEPLIRRSARSRQPPDRYGH